MTIILATILLVNERRDLNGSGNFWRIKFTIVSNSLTALVEGDLPTSRDNPLQMPSTVGDVWLCRSIHEFFSNVLEALHSGLANLLLNSQYCAESLVKVRTQLRAWIFCRSLDSLIVQENGS